ncbi:MAG TPA: hypothetical protein VGJ77_12370 [Gaiellaceae bacterium]|jgi:hypothetical protein
MCFRHRLRTLVASCAALTALVAAASPQTALAAPGIQYGLHDDAWLRDGPGALEDRLSKLDELGVEVVRYNLRWDRIATQRPAAPTSDDDPAYTWTDDDPVVNGLRAHGIAVVLGLVGTPAWANGGRATNVAPTNARTFGDFAAAAATHYPWVKRWLVWNEPNQRRWLIPTTAAVYVTRLLNPAYAALHSRIAGVRVGGGVTAPRGATGGVSPIAWLRGMRAAHARLDAYAHNPYPLNPKRESPRAGGCGHCDTISMATLGRLVAEVSRSFGGARIWLTEYGYQTNPPDRLLGVPPALQARYIGDAGYQAYKTPRVDMLIQFLYRDEPDLARFQSGLVRLSGAPKPALTAFQLPLAEVSRRGTRTTLWGQIRAPGAVGTYRIQRSTGGPWRDVGPARPAGRGAFFLFTADLPRGARVRLVAGSLTSPPLVVI